MGTPWENLLTVLPEHIRREPIRTDGLTEVRIRLGQRMEAVYGKECVLLECVADESDCTMLLENISRHSLYSVQEALCRGYLTLSGGIRVGVAGNVRMQNGTVTLIHPVTGFCFRMARELVGCAENVMREIGTESTIVISPPGGGKTTLLRDMARIASEDGYHVVLLDERGELAAAWEGPSPFRIGLRTDVLSGVPKAIGIEMALRTLSPDLIVCDEIGQAEDAAALADAARAGVTVFASVHGKNADDLKKRPMLRSCLADGGFTKAIILKNYHAAVERL